jgi:2-polyprenyl-6-methoxyphenol hydroxylase-like FAD-dependent oxidoreductase
MKFFSSAISTPPTGSILIVGGGPSGLFLANLLQSYEIPFYLLDGQSTQQRFRHPQAHFINTRSMEVLKHALPSKVFKRIQSAMPDVEEWKSFRFGPNMKANTMAEVIHPVDRPIRVDQDSNGIMVDPNHRSFTNESEENPHVDLSDCSVGHLAQHTFCRILYDAAMEHESAKKSIFYNTKVSKASHENGVWKVTTEIGKEFQSTVVIAADGARSWWRNDVLNINMNGQTAIQHLVNVHFTLEGEKDDVPPAMLYTIFSPQVLAMVVRHAPREYVMQIPYFPPYQSLEDDFTNDKVQTMISVALGGNKDDASFKIQSIEPWTMGSLVAQDYFKQQVFLVGDAAHVFPPAGGFGMNTGLQDAQNLAWRLALRQHAYGIPSMDAIGRAYQADRQPVARQNAALSVRNYQRVLGVMDACYLNHQHPSALIQALDASSFFVPLEIRRQTFQTALKTALWPLGQLKTSPEGFFAQHASANLQTLLKQGEGLPLLFPNHEVGFRYRSTSNSTDIDDASNDTIGKLSSIEEGRLFPHLPVAVNQNAQTLYPQLCQVENNKTIITTRDLPAQLATLSLPCTFCLLQITSSNTVQSVSCEIAQVLSEKLKYPFKLANLEIVDGDMTTTNQPPSTDQCLNLQIDQHTWSNLKLGTLHPEKSTWVVIRPDGHIASVVDSTEGDSVGSLVDRIVAKAVSYI